MRHTNNLGLALYDKTDKMAITSATDSLNRNMELIDRLATFVTPEMFGAVGDGITDDTVALNSMFNSGNKNIYIPNKVYRFSSFTVQNIDDLLVECSGTLKHNDFSSQTYTELVKFINCNCLKLKGFHIDGNHRFSRCMILKHCVDATLEDLFIENVGQKDVGDTHCFAIGIWDGSDNCKIVRHKISKVYSNSVTTGIYIYDNETQTGELLPRNCRISDGLIEDIYPITDGDGLKILNKLNNDDINLNVTNCTFIDCRKRALKFQARGCHSIGNTMIWNEKGKVPIDMQRGYCTSLNDTVITNYHQDEVEHVYGYFDYLVGMFGAYNRVTNIGFFVNSNPMWMVDSTYTDFSGYGALVCLGSFDELVDSSGHVIDTTQKEHISHDNVIDGVYGNGVMRNLVSISFISEENAPSDISVLEGLRFYVEKNIMKNVKIRLTNRGLIVNQNRYTYKTYASFRFNKLNNIGIYMVSDASNATINSPSDYGTAEVTVQYNDIDFNFDKDVDGRANTTSLSGAINKGFLHSNKLNFTGMYRCYENFSNYNVLKQDNNSQNYRDIYTVSGVFYSSVNPQDDTQTWRTQSLASASVGDVCFKMDGQIIDSGVKKGWICVEEPSTDYPRGKWENWYESKSNMRYEEDTSTLYISL